LDQEREALIVVREVVQRRILGAREVRSHYVTWREERGRGNAASFLDHLVAKRAIEPVMREMLLLQVSMASDPDAQAEQKIRTLVLDPPEPAATPPATTPPQPLQPTLDGRLVPARHPSARLVHSHGDTPGAALPRPRGETPPSASPRPKDDGEVELITPGGVPVGSEPPVGTRLGRYELLEVAGRGGMGTVFKARIHPSEEVCAVKVLGGPERMPGTSRRARFRREIMATARLDHENVVRVRDAGHAGGIEFMVMDFVEGEGLERLLAKGSLTLEQRLEILVGVAAGVAHAHERGVIHRDLKPQNVLVDAVHIPRVVDFGLAKIEEQESGLTRTGASLGTPFYMAPEQFMGASQVGPKADVFSLGVMLYELITLERPFQGASSVEVADKVRNTEPPAPSTKNPHASKDLDAVCFRAIEKSQDRRYANAGEFLADLEAALAGNKVSARVARPTEKILKAAKAYRAPASGFLVACAIFVPLIIVLATRRDAVPVPTPTSGISTVLAQALETARAELEAVPAPGDPELPRGSMRRVSRSSSTARSSRPRPRATSPGRARGSRTSSSRRLSARSSRGSSSSSRGSGGSSSRSRAQERSERVSRPGVAPSSAGCRESSRTARSSSAARLSEARLSGARRASARSRSGRPRSRA
jgi:serine/threonine protein kinase